MANALTLKSPTLKSPLAANASVNEDDVIAAKTALMNLGLYEVPEWGITGVPDRALFDAIRTFQKGTQLKIDGVMKPGGETESTLKTAAELVRRHGRNGDTILAHISPAEADLLHRVTDGGSINPETGLPEFFLGSMLGGLASRFVGSFAGPAAGSMVGSTVSNFAAPVIGDYVSRKVGKKIGGPLGDDIANSLGNTVSGAVGGLASNGLTNAFGLEAKSAPQPESQPAPSPISDGVKDLLNPDYSSARTPGINPSGRQPRAISSTAPKLGSPTLGSPTLGSPARTSPSKPQPQQQTPWLPPLLASEPRANIMEIKPDTPRPRAQTMEIKSDRPALDLPAETISSNARTANALMKTSDFSAIKPHIQDAWTNGGEQGRAEVVNLVEQMKDRNAEHGAKFEQEMGLDRLPNTSRHGLEATNIPTGINEQQAGKPSPINISGIPEGAILSAGADNGDGSGQAIPMKETYRSPSGREVVYELDDPKYRAVLSRAESIGIPPGTVDANNPLDRSLVEAYDQLDDKSEDVKQEARKIHEKIQELAKTDPRYKKMLEGLDRARAMKLSYAGVGQFPGSVSDEQLKREQNAERVTSVLAGGLNEAEWEQKHREFERGDDLDKLSMRMGVKLSDEAKADPRTKTALIQAMTYRHQTREEQYNTVKNLRDLETEYSDEFGGKGVIGNLSSSIVRPSFDPGSMNERELREEIESNKTVLNLLKGAKAGEGASKLGLGTKTHLGMFMNVTGVIKSFENSTKELEFLLTHPKPR